jgi:hypothetical protein
MRAGETRGHFAQNDNEESKLSLARGEADFAEEGGAAGAGGAGEIGGAAVRGFVGEQRKGEGFLGVAGQAKGFGGGDLHIRKRGGEFSEDQRIARASAGNNQLWLICARLRTRDVRFFATRARSGFELSRGPAVEGFGDC